MAELSGLNLIAGEAYPGHGEAIHAVNPASGETLEPGFAPATLEQVDLACRLAAEAAIVLAGQTPAERAALLTAIADRIDALKPDLVPRVMAETALPQGRVEGELGRTTGQLRLFAAEVLAGDWLGVRVDTALPDRAPVARPDLRLRKIPLGPVAVFGASNFPLAFSVAGGDTASALAAGCPVVVKAHPAHPGASELVGRAISEAVAAQGLPPGVFAMLHGGVETGSALVQHPAIKAVGFTGSRAGGLAIAKLCAARPEPVPVYAEMSSINPVLVMPGALAARGPDIARGFAASLAMGAGQFCTNPGLVFVIGSDEAAYAAFRDAAAEAVSAQPAQAMLTAGIAGAYERGVANFASHPGVTEIAHGQSAPHCQAAALMETSVETFAADPALHEEVFGAVSVIVRSPSAQALRPLLAKLEGQLTITLQMDDADLSATKALLPVLERKAGRILVNAFPTGVEVCHAMVHGGPYPATSDSRTTSVGTLAIERFLRPVCYQGFPDGLLPDTLKADNPLGLPRRVNGVREG